MTHIVTDITQRQSRSLKAMHLICPNHGNIQMPFSEPGRSAVNAFRVLDVVNQAVGDDLRHLINALITLFKASRSKPHSAWRLIDQVFFSEGILRNPHVFLSLRAGLNQVLTQCRGDY